MFPKESEEFKDECIVEYKTDSVTTIEVIENEYSSFPQVAKSEQDITKHKTRNNALYFIFKAMIPLAILIHPITNESSLKQRLVKTWCIALFVFNSAMLVVASLNAHKMFPDTASCISFYIFSIFGYLTLLTLGFKRRQTYSAAQTITNLSRRLGVKVVGSKTVKYELMACILTSISYMIIYIKFFFYEEWYQYLKIFRVPFGLPARPYIWTAIFGLVSYTILNFSTCLLTVMLLYNMFLSVSALIQSYIDRIKDQNFAISDDESMSQYLVLFREISTCVKNVDDALNWCTFFILGAVTGSFFAAISIAFSSSPRFHSFIARTFVGCTLVGCLAIFFILTTTGNRMVVSYKNLKAILLEWSEKMGRYSSEPAVIRLFVLLADNVRKANLAFTGCQMFVINKSLMLTVGSTVITYSFLLFQINNNQD